MLQRKNDDKKDLNEWLFNWNEFSNKMRWVNDLII